MARIVVPRRRRAQRRLHDLLTMTNKPSHEFGKRRPVGAPLITPAPVKRSSHVALLLMGTLAVGGGAFALMPSETCQQTPPGMATSTECQPRGSSSSGS